MRQRSREGVTYGQSVYFTYVDETGTDGKSPCLVMVGIVVDAQRLRRTQDEFGQIFAGLDGITTKSMRELKSNDLLAGNGPWRDVPGHRRREVVTQLCDWLTDRKHRLALASIGTEKLAEQSDQAPNSLSSAWPAAAFHIALQLQAAHGSKKSGKGRTILVFDDQRIGMPRLVELIVDPPTWTDDFYGRGPRDAALDQLVDTPFSVQSHHVGLIQVADVFAAVLRRYAELRDFGHAEKYEGESDHVTEWTRLLESRLLPRSTRWPQRTSSPCARWYSSLAPKSLIELGG